MLHFPDNTKVRVTGLMEILADLFAEGRPADQATAAEIITRLENQKNFIPSSDLIRREFLYVLLKEYREYVQGREPEGVHRSPLSGESRPGNGTVRKKDR
jgi:hypothetical protein